MARVVYPIMPMSAALSAAGTGPTGHEGQIKDDRLSQAYSAVESFKRI